MQEPDNFEIDRRDLIVVGAAGVAATVEQSGARASSSISRTAPFTLSETRDITGALVTIGLAVAEACDKAIVGVASKE